MPPTRAPRRCSQSGCRELVRSRALKCPQHLRAAERQRPNAGQRGYDGKWQKIRARFLQAHPYCRECLREGPWSLTIIATPDGFNYMDSVEVFRWQRDGFAVCG